MLFIYADILWVLRFMFQGNRGYPQGCDAAFSLPVCSALLSEFLLSVSGWV